MSFIFRPWQLFLLGLSGWINRQQQHMIEYPSPTTLKLITKCDKISHLDDYCTKTLGLLDPEGAPIPTIR